MSSLQIQGSANIANPKRNDQQQSIARPDALLSSEGAGLTTIQSVFAAPSMQSILMKTQSIYEKQQQQQQQTSNSYLDQTNASPINAGSTTTTTTAMHPNQQKQSKTINSTKQSLTGNLMSGSSFVIFSNNSASVTTATATNSHSHSSSQQHLNQSQQQQQSINQQFQQQPQLPFIDSQQKSSGQQQTQQQNQQLQSQQPKHQPYAFPRQIEKQSSFLKAALTGKSPSTLEHKNPAASTNSISAQPSLLIPTNMSSILKPTQPFVPIRMSIKPTMETIQIHNGDSYISMHEESLLLAHSSMIESDQIRERNIHSVTRNHPSNHISETTKLLQDLIEPRYTSFSEEDLEEEEVEEDVEEEDNEHDDLNETNQKRINRQNNNNASLIAIPASNNNQENRGDYPDDLSEKSSQKSINFDSTLPPPSMLGRPAWANSLHNNESDYLEELALLNQQHIVTRRPRESTISPPSSNITNNNNNSISNITRIFHTATTATSLPSNQPPSSVLADKRKSSAQHSNDRRVSQSSTDGRTVRVSTSETIFSINQKQGIGSHNFCLPQISVIAPPPQPPLPSSQSSTTIDGCSFDQKIRKTTHNTNQPSEHYQRQVIAGTEEDEEQIMLLNALSESSSILIVPDEPQKSELKPAWCFSACGTTKRSLGNCEIQNGTLNNSKLLPSLSQSLASSSQASLKMISEDMQKITKIDSISPSEYFVPQLMRCFDAASKRDKQQQLYWAYFTKTFQSYSSQAKNFIETSQPLSAEPIFLPKLDNPNKKTIFFDLDETLIHSIRITCMPEENFTPQMARPAAAAAAGSGSSANYDINYQIGYPQAQLTPQTQNRNETSKSAFPSRNSDSCNEVICNIYNYENRDIQCLVSIRPHAVEVLTELAKDFELILLTAARQIFADAVLEKLDPEGVLFSHRFYRESCLELKLAKSVGNRFPPKVLFLKDLRVFSNRKLENIMLVDNSPLTFLQNIPNGIPIIDYCNDNKNDIELLQLCAFLKSLLHVRDVREHIQPKFLLQSYKQFSQIEQLQEFLTSTYLYQQQQEQLINID